jgi:hypothetical protein
MSETPIETTQTMLESLVEETDDSEVHFKLRTAMQLLDIAEEQYDAGRRALAEVELDQDTRENLEELGYLP